MTLTPTRAHVYRAILEGIAYGFRHHLAVLAERGLTVTRVRVSNGEARSALWKQVTADVLGLPLEEIAHHPGSWLGAAFVAGMGVGVFVEWGEIERFIQISGIVEPSPLVKSRYESLFAVCRELYERNRDLFGVLGQQVDIERSV